MSAHPEADSIFDDFDGCRRAHQQLSTSYPLLVSRLDKVAICKCSTPPTASAGGLQKIAVLALPFILSANFAPDPFLDM